MKKILFCITCILVVSVSLLSAKEYDKPLVSQTLGEELQEKGLSLGSPIFIRIFKASSELQVWVKNSHNTFTLFKTYPICYYSGNLGPKLKQGDNQAPEGFYFVKKSQLNPYSRFHLSFNLGYPNKYDRLHNRTGNYLMVHGNCVSIGCYAMTDARIEEIYTLAEAALNNGQSFFRVHIFPFKMTDANMEKYKDHKWHGFWGNLKEGYDFFEKHGSPPNVEVRNKRYVFDGGTS